MTDPPLVQTGFTLTIEWPDHSRYQQHIRAGIPIHQATWTITTVAQAMHPDRRANATWSVTPDPT